MQPLALFSWWIFIRIIFAPKVLSSSVFIERALFDSPYDESLFNDDPTLDDINSWNQNVNIDSNGLLGDNGQGFSLDSKGILADNAQDISLDSNGLLADNAQDFSLDSDGSLTDSDLDLSLDSDKLLADSALDPTTKFDPNQPLAENGFLDQSGSNFWLSNNDAACDVDDTENTHIFDKVRRGNLCRDPPLGQSDAPDQSGQQDPFEDIKKMFNKDPLASFNDDTEICSKRRFDTSNIPVCKDEFPPEDILPIPLAVACNLRNIEPGMAIFAVLLSAFAATADRIYKVISLTGVSICPVGVTLWCCQSVIYSVCIPWDEPNILCIKFDKLRHINSRDQICPLLLGLMNSIICYARLNISSAST